MSVESVVIFKHTATSVALEIASFSKFQEKHEVSVIMFGVCAVIISYVAKSFIGFSRSHFCSDIDIPMFLFLLTAQVGALWACAWHVRSVESLEEEFVKQPGVVWVNYSTIPNGDN